MIKFTDKNVLNVLYNQCSLVTHFNVVLVLGFIFYFSTSQLGSVMDGGDFTAVTETLSREEERSSTK